VSAGRSNKDEQFTEEAALAVVALMEQLQEWWLRCTAEGLRRNVGNGGGSSGSNYSGSSYAETHDARYNRVVGCCCGSRVAAAAAAAAAV
jgi:hypothetical protein